ncbi:predicted protein [Naegleria gruberi]|uniref:Predicted protein n=1 Tax=Naegleria gruberi TaxID=5762 RepID=D2V9B9_NAEGR|nr:uncharacterized protein NAEGRDRAFT_65386 [Naegleria gruberi]EFC46565.1 predicted protein [Naegleria gruberi]|eukprot:XP_002679309.1 predicted protein [Naegleria gruberi strain NEG-M]
MTHEKQHQHLNYTGDHLNSATVRRALNSEELLPKPPHLLNRVPSPSKKKTKLESYYVHALPPQKINPNTLHVDKKKNESQLEEIDRKKYTLNPYTTAQTSDLYNKKLQTKREIDETFKATKTKPTPHEHEYDAQFETTFNTMMTRKLDGKAKEDLNQLTNGEYGSRQTLETFNSHYTRYGRKKITFD